MRFKCRLSLTLSVFALANVCYNYDTYRYIVFMFHYTAFGSVQRMNSATTASLERVTSSPVESPNSAQEDRGTEPREEVLVIPVPVSSSISQEHLHNHNRLHSRDHNVVLVPVAFPRASKMEAKIKTAKQKQEKSKNEKLMTYQQRVIRNTNIWKQQVIPKYDIM